MLQEYSVSKKYGIDYCTGVLLTQTSKEIVSLWSWIIYWALDWTISALEISMCIVFRAGFTYSRHRQCSAGGSVVTPWGSRAPSGSWR
jgi:hypothetical protein